LQNETLITFLRENAMSDCVKAINETNFPACRATAYRRINQSALGNYYAARKPFLKNGHKETESGICNGISPKKQYLGHSSLFRREDI
jgi:hypothetical protein